MHVPYTIIVPSTIPRSVCACATHVTTPNFRLRRSDILVVPEKLDFSIDVRVSSSHVEQPNFGKMSMGESLALYSVRIRFWGRLPRYRIA